MLPAFTLWWREIVRFYRQRSRVVGVIASPLLFWLVIGSGFGTSFRAGNAAGQQHYLDYFYPGVLVMIILFTAIFTMMSVIEDRKEGFLLSVLVAPVPRAAIVLGKVLGGTTLAATQGLIFLVFSPLVGIHMTLASFGLIVLTVFLVSFALTALGFAIAWPMDSTAAFQGLRLDSLDHVCQSIDLRRRGLAYPDVSRGPEFILAGRIALDPGPVC